MSGSLITRDILNTMQCETIIGIILTLLCWGDLSKHTEFKGWPNRRDIGQAVTTCLAGLCSQEFHNPATSVTTDITLPSLRIPGQHPRFKGYEPKMPSALRSIIHQSNSQKENLNNSGWYTWSCVYPFNVPMGDWKTSKQVNTYSEPLIYMQHYLDSIRGNFQSLC